jgi:nickel-type superoxide dismutase maturation protease
VFLFGRRHHPTQKGPGATLEAWRPRRVTVSGDSMRPAFRPGDRLLILPAARVRVGDVVALPDPRQPDRLMVKRVSACAGGLVEVLGDNQAASTDSRDFGAVARRAIVGKVVYRYAPRDRVGWRPH